MQSTFECVFGEMGEKIKATFDDKEIIYEVDATRKRAQYL